MRTGIASRLRRRGAFPAALAAVAFAVGLGGCGEAEPELEGDGRALIVAIDAASFPHASRLIEDGRLPNLEAIASRGLGRPLRSMFAMEPSRNWTIVATGREARMSKIRGFERTKVGFTSFDRRVPALWNILTDAGLSVGVVGWWNTYPVEKVNGVFVSDARLSRGIAGREELRDWVGSAGGPFVHPEAWRDRVEAARAAEGVPGDTADPFADAEALPDWIDVAALREAHRTDAAIARVALEVEDGARPDVLMVYLPGLDPVSHVRWGAVHPRSARPGSRWKRDEREAALEALARYYAFLDGVVGELARRFGRTDLVMVVSGFGMEAANGPGPVTGLHKTANAVEGIVFARGPRIADVEERRRRVILMDVVPTLLGWLELPIAREMTGAPAYFLEPADPAGPPPDTVASYMHIAIERLGEEPGPGIREALIALDRDEYLRHRPEGTTPANLRTPRRERGR